MAKKLAIGFLLAAVALAGIYHLWPAADVESGAAGGYVDLHVHAAGIGEGGSGCFLSGEMRHGYKFNFYLRAFDLSLEEIRSAGDVVLLRKLSRKIAASKRVSKAVVLALDGVVDEAGELDRERTQVYVPNEYLARELRAFDNLLFGASINPRRKDALERLERVKTQGAVLVKWIPCIMGFNPADESLIPFYRRLRELQLPLLSHAGQEKSFGKSNDELCDPRHLVLALEQGVTVIAAHVASAGSTRGESNFDRLLPMFEEHENLYADISALTQINRLGYLNRALADAGVRERLVYGSDWPLQFFPLVSAWYQVPHVDLAHIKAVQGLDNKWDRDVVLKRAMGTPDAVFRRSAQVLGITP